MGKYIVRTQDVDGTSAQLYKDRADAVKRFEEMVGYTMKQVADFQYDNPPDTDKVTYLRGVSMYGTVVEFKTYEE